MRKAIVATHNNLRETHSVGRRTRESIVTEVTCPALRTHRIKAAGISAAQHGFSWVRLAPAFSVAMVCFHGRGEVFSDGEWRPCVPGNAYLMPAHRLHAYRAVKRAPWNVGWAIYDESDATRGREAFIRLTQATLVACDAHPIRDALQGLCREATGTAEPAVARLWAELLHAHLERLAQPARDDEPLRRLFERVDADPGFAWTNEVLARLCAMSAETLRRRCHRRFSRSPMEQVAFLRMNRAAALLSRTPEKIEAVAQAVGYESIFTFSAAFKRVMGLPPSHYRHSHRAR